MILYKNFIAILIPIAAISILILLNQYSNSSDDFSHLVFEANYIEDKDWVKITFEDKTGKSTFAILEILGMETTYHEEFEIQDSKFSKIVPIENMPKYGWKTTPVTLEIMHGEYTLKMKTEIYEVGDEKPKIIFSLHG